MKRLLWLLALVTVAALPALALEPDPPPATSQAAPSTGMAPQGLNGPMDLYGSFWFPGVCEAEWSSFLIPTGPANFWDAYTWGFVRFRYWFEAQRYGWGWPPNLSPLGWGWDGWYGGWYGWLPDGMPAGMGMGSSWGGYPPLYGPFQVRPLPPAEVIAPRPVAHRPKPTRGWFGGAIRPARADERFSNSPEDWSRGGLTAGGPDPKPTSRGGRISPPPVYRPPSPPVPSYRPPIRRR